MARPKPNPEEVLPLITRHAIDLIKSEGFERMTMKRLAQKCAMSVGKLYHFFPSKDDLFLTLEIEYFDGIYAHIQDAISGFPLESGDAVARFRCMLVAYYDYAVEHMALYQLVTSPPKVYAHYLGTQSEALATRDLVSAMRAIALFREHFERAVKAKHQGVPDTIDSQFLLFVNTIHGLILMSRSTAWPYISLSQGGVDKDRFAATPDASATQPDIQKQIDLIVEKLI